MSSPESRDRADPAVMFELVDRMRLDAPGEYLSLYRVACRFCSRELGTTLFQWKPWSSAGGIAGWVQTRLRPELVRLDLPGWIPQWGVRRAVHRDPNRPLLRRGTLKPELIRGLGSAGPSGRHPDRFPWDRYHDFQEKSWRFGVRCPSCQRRQDANLRTVEVYDPLLGADTPLDEVRRCEGADGKLKYRRFGDDEPRRRLKRRDASYRGQPGRVGTKHVYARLMRAPADGRGHDAIRLSYLGEYFVLDLDLTNARPFDFRGRTGEDLARQFRLMWNERPPSPRLEFWNSQRVARNVGIAETALDAFLAATAGDFPAQLATFNDGPIWEASAVQRWLKVNRPGPWVDPRWPEQQAGEAANRPGRRSRAPSTTSPGGRSTPVSSAGSSGDDRSRGGALASATGRAQRHTVRRTREHRPGPRAQPPYDFELKIIELHELTSTELRLQAARHLLVSIAAASPEGEAEAHVDDILLGRYRDDEIDNGRYGWLGAYLIRTEDGVVSAEAFVQFPGVFLTIDRDGDIQSARIKLRFERSDDGQRYMTFGGETFTAQVAEAVNDWLHDPEAWAVRQEAVNRRRE